MQTVRIFLEVEAEAPVAGCMTGEGWYHNGETEVQKEQWTAGSGVLIQDWLPGSPPLPPSSPSMRQCPEAVQEGDSKTWALPGEAGPLTRVGGSGPGE